MSVLSPASAGILSRAVPWPPLPPRRIYRPSVYRPFIRRYSWTAPVIVVGAHAYDLSRWAHRCRLSMLVTTISRRIQGERRTVMTLHHRQWMTRTGNPLAPMMKPNIAIRWAFFTPNAARRDSNQRLLFLSKYVRDVKKTCVISEMMSLFPSLFLRGDSHRKMRVSSGLRSPRLQSRASFSSTTISVFVFYGPDGPCQVFCFENTLLMPLGLLRNTY